ncbi:rhomboid family intramembrane serine protease [Ferruginibacter sp. HRS2-29]|uniref:rhomboid family intramembrane serine protease n=1 Tax=Ferruginibacter sp. HRS2-29 TaxID=2487334 RepID=UPI0020CC4A4F|nr:rhomboid family intramembrane serine protease [Ferruginibacter sp. HRS2-29]MCP9749841.1 rhomboid family intramembrane serine protease [Ferruginibacter sp. HRS2-29]
MDFSQSPITFILIAINVIFSIIGFSNDSFVSKTILWPYGIKREKQYGRFITSGFLHADWGHLFFNMFTFFFFGQQVERVFTYYGLGGKIAFILLYFLALIVSDLPSYFKNRDNPSYRALGASGAVSAVVFAGILFNPWGRLYIYAAIPISYTLFAVLYIVYCIYMSRRASDNVNHDAHLYGSLFGLLFTILLIGIMNPSLITPIIEQFKNPSILGR